MGQIAHAGRVGQPAGARLIAIAVATVLAAGTTAAAVVPGGRSAAEAGTTVVHPVGATVLRASGTTVPAYDGVLLRPGDTLRTTANGSATLLTDGRREHVVGASSVLVRDGQHQQLRAGAVVLDVRSGPSVVVTVAGTTVRADGGDVLRIEHGFTVRIGALAGAAEVRTAAGRGATVPTLHQVRVNADALPDAAPAPLALVDDAAERATNLPVVVDDVLLRRWAQGAGADPAAGPRLTAAVRSAALPTTACQPAVAGSVGEQVLPLAVARSSPERGSLATRYGQALCYRDAGGSWGVIAHLLRTTAVRTLAQVDALQNVRALALGSDTAAPRTAAVVADEGPASSPAGVTPTGPPESSGSGSAGTPRSEPASGGSTPPPPTGAPSPQPTPSPGDGLVGGLVGAVVGLLPPPPSPAPSGGGGLLGLHLGGG